MARTYLVLWRADMMNLKVQNIISAFPTQSNTLPITFHSCRGLETKVASHAKAYSQNSSAHLGSFPMLRDIDLVSQATKAATSLMCNDICPQPSCLEQLRK